jgi:prolyl oligopeptidase
VFDVSEISRRDLFVGAGSLCAAFLTRRALAAAGSARIPPAPVARVAVVKDDYFGETEKPVLLRVDFDAGHGIGSTRAQQDREAADTHAFLLWQTGMKAYQPA